MKLIGKTVTITARDSMYCGEWGIVADYDGEYYYVAIAGDRTAMPIFERREFKVRKDS